MSNRAKEISRIKKVLAAFEGTLDPALQDLDYMLDVLREYMDKHWAGCRTNDPDMCKSCREWLEVKEILNG